MVGKEEAEEGGGGRNHLYHYLRFWDILTYTTVPFLHGEGGIRYDHYNQRLEFW